MARRNAYLERLQVEQFDERRRQLVVAAWEKGLAISAIAELVGLDRRLVLAILEERDWTPESQGSGGPEGTHPHLYE